MDNRTAAPSLPTTDDRTKPPEGKYITSAVLYIRENSDGANSMDDKILTNAQAGDFSMCVDVVARDTYTGENVILTNVRVKTHDASVATGYAKGQSFELTAPSYEAFTKGRVDQMVVTRSAQKPMIQNEAIPVQALIRNDISSLAESSTAECRKFNERYNMLKRQLGIIHDRDDLTVLSSGKNGRAPGVLISDNDGVITMFDNSGKQNFTMTGDKGASISSSQFDINSSQRASTNTMGQYVKYNEVNEYIPQGTILNPSQMSEPNITKYLSLVQTVTDFADLLVTMTSAISEFCQNNMDDMEEIGNSTPNSDLISQAYVCKYCGKNYPQTDDKCPRCGRAK